MEDVSCKVCRAKADAKVSGMNSKFPNHWYYTCPVCISPKGNGNLFIKMGNPASQDCQDERAPKKRKWEPSSVQNFQPELNKTMNEKIDLLLTMVEQIMSYMENPGEKSP